MPIMRLYYHKTRVDPYDDGVHNRFMGWEEWVRQQLQ